jgi:uncharacterized protein YdaU (DUF1376 family)
MNRPWMPLYVADYLADTAHLRVEEHGSYLLLIMHYWRTGRLPTDDAALARISRMTRAEWKKAKPAIQPLFLEGWKHKRVEFELTENARISAAGHIGGKASAAARRKNKEQQNQTLNLTTVEKSLNDHANDSSTNGQALQPQPQSPIKEVSKRDDDASAKPPLISQEAFEVEREMGKIVGIDPDFVPPAWFGAPHKIQAWLSNGWPAESIIASTRMQMAARNGKPPPSTAGYFEKGIADFIANNARPIPIGEKNAASTSSELSTSGHTNGGSSGNRKQTRDDIIIAGMRHVAVKMAGDRERKRQADAIPIERPNGADTK